MLVYPYSKSDNRSYVKLIDLRNLKEEFASWDIHCANASSMDISDDGRILLLSTNDSSLVVIDAIDGNIKTNIKKIENVGGFCTCSISGDSKWAAVGSELNNSIKIYNLESGELVNEMLGHSRTPHQIVWNKHYGLLVSACWNVISWIPN